MKPNVEQEGGDKPSRNSHCVVVIVYVGNYVMLNDSSSDGPMCAVALRGLHLPRFS
jgi:hypothetical protein